MTDRARKVAVVAPSSAGCAPRAFARVAPWCDGFSDGPGGSETLVSARATVARNSSLSSSFEHLLGRAAARCGTANALRQRTTEGVDREGLQLPADSERQVYPESTTSLVLLCRLPQHRVLGGT